MAKKKSKEKESLWREIMERQMASGVSVRSFCHRRRDRMKVLYWGETGFCIWYQQLQRGTYQLPSEESIEITRSQLSLILDGIDLGSARQRMRFQLPTEPREREEAAVH